MIERPRRLVFSFSAGDSEPDRVSIGIVPLESGCELTLTHEMKPEWAAWADRTTEGWAGMLADLAAVVEGPSPGLA